MGGWVGMCVWVWGWVGLCHNLLQSIQSRSPQNLKLTHGRKKMNYVCVYVRVWGG